MAQLWTDNIREIWRNKGFDGTPNNPIVTETANHLIKPINDVFGQAIDYDSPDYALRETLKENIWDFSVAKNYQDNVRLNNLLLDDQGKLRSWSDFKHEAQKVVGTSNRYLRTEYNTVVAGAQMSRLWQDIQKDKHLFPFVQFDVVEDKRTSDICEPLSDVIMSVDDPVLVNYFPPNHFNCRTTVRRLHSGVPTENYNLPDIPKAFKNNVAATGEVFTKENAYIANTPEKSFGLSEKYALTQNRKEILAFARKHFVGKTILKDGVKIHFTRKGMEHAISQNHDAIFLKNALIKDIKKVIKQGSFIKTAPDNKGRKQFVYHYYSVKGYDNMFIVLREVLNNKQIQFYSITDKLQ